MPDDPGSVSLDPWRVAADLATEAAQAEATHPELAARLDEMTAAFGTGGSSTADLLDELDHHTTIDAVAPVASSRPVIPVVKGSVRKATDFITRHVAQQVTVVGTGLVTALRQVDRRIAALERGVDPTAAAALVPALPATLEALLTDGLAADAVVRRVGTWPEVATLPPQDADLIVIVRLGEVVDASRREELLDRTIGALVPGGQLAVVSHTPSAWAVAAGPVLADLAPGRPLHPETWCHLFERRGASGTAVHATGDGFVALGRW
jgi:hypothetical protein